MGDNNDKEDKDIKIYEKSPVGDRQRKDRKRKDKILKKNLGTTKC